MTILLYYAIIYITFYAVKEKIILGEWRGMKMITAIYDCRSKQEYIYRTNKIREIAGASKLLSNVYNILINESGLKINNTWRDDAKQKKTFRNESFVEDGFDGTVIYEGGGNLYMLFKDKETYIRANRAFSRILLEESYSISIITAFVETTDNFNSDREKLYLQKEKSKKLGMHSVICNVLPFTQTDRMSFMPLSATDTNGTKRTTEAVLKRKAYKSYFTQSDELGSENLDSLVEEKGKDSILAVIYIDGNDMGNKIKKCTEGKNDYSECVTALREFSINTNEYFVDRPIQAIEQCLRQKNEKNAELIEKHPYKAHKYRLIVGGGDEITIICRGSDTLDIIKTYFEELSDTPELSTGIPNTSCAGIALFHSHAPFADVYNIAESCCESGKKESHKPNNNNNYVDFHYCHSGITNELDVIRDKQEANYTLRPYSIAMFNKFISIGRILNSIGRSNVKILGDSIIKGDSFYKFEIQRIRAKKINEFNKLIDNYAANEDQLKRFIYDVSVVFDLWFGGEDNV